MSAGTAMAVRPPLDLADVDPERRAGVALDETIVRNRQWDQQHRRPKSLSAREALAALVFESEIVWMAAFNLANNVELSDADRARLTLACRFIDEIAQVAI